jgi:hypothetical protein
MLQGIKNPRRRMPAISGGERMSDRSEMFAPAVFIMVEPGCGAGLSRTLPEADRSEEDASCISIEK